MLFFLNQTFLLQYKLLFFFLYISEASEVTKADLELFQEEVRLSIDLETPFSVSLQTLECLLQVTALFTQR